MFFFAFFAYLLRSIVGSFFTWLERRGLKERLITRINEHIDIPMIDEETEQKVFEAIYEIIRHSVLDTTAPPPTREPTETSNLIAPAPSYTAAEESKTPATELV